MITKQDLHEMFENINKSTSWNLSKEMLWGYFFTCRDKIRLENLNTHLVDSGYRFVDIHKNKTEEDIETSFYWLHVEKIEKHTVNSLNKRNQELYKLASKFEVDSYDGMDVGPVL